MRHTNSTTHVVRAAGKGALAALLATVVAACASGGRRTDQQSTAPTQPATVQGPQLPSARPDARWPVRAREHVDLWLHGFALLQSDTTKVPFFRRGYKDSVTAFKTRASIISMLDANRDKLTERFRAFPNLTNAQFVALYFGSWEDLKRAADLLAKAEGDARSRNTDPSARQVVATLAGYFPTPADREWLRLYVQSLDDESTKYYHSYWQNAQRDRAATIAHLDSLWQLTYRPKLQRFLNATQQANGDFVVSLPLDGEGRTVAVGTALSVVAVTLPERLNEAEEAIYVLAHEVVGSVGNAAIADNTSPADRRAGLADQYSSPALVRGGLMLLQRVVPELAEGYARYYLRSANVPLGSGGAIASLEAAFPLPDALRDALRRQIEVTLGGI
jgi:hypothetical protein